MRPITLAALLLTATACSPAGTDEIGNSPDFTGESPDGLVRFDVYPPQDSELTDDRGLALNLRPQTFVEDVTETGDVALLLTPAVRIRGQVLGEALTPWPTAEVPSVVDTLVDAEMRFGLEGNIQQPRTETDDEGRYDVLIVPSDVPYEIAVVPSTPDVPVYTERVNIDGTTIELDLFIDAGVPLWGTVRNDDGEPLEGLMVSAIDSRSLEGAPVMTDINGRYLLTVAPGQAYTVKAAPPGREPLATLRRSTETVQNQGLEVPITFSGTAFSTVTGQVRSPSGALVGDGDVRVRLFAEDIDGFTSGEARFELDLGTDGGTFTALVPRGLYRVEVSPQKADGPSPLTVDDVRVGSQVSTVVGLDLPAKIARVGVVSDDAGIRVGGASVTCTENRFAKRAWTTSSDPSGAFVLAVPLADTTCAITPPSSRASELALTRQKIEGDQALDVSSEWTLVIKRGTVASGRVQARMAARLDADIGDAVPASVVEVRDFSGQLLGVGVTDDDGRFQIRIAR